MVAGMAGHNLKYFADVRFRDSSFHHCVSWDERKVLQIIGTSSPSGKNLELAEDISEDVKVNLDTTGIWFKSKVTQFLGHVFPLPWLEKVSHLQQDTMFIVKNLNVFTSNIARTRLGALVFLCDGSKVAISKII